MASDRTSACGIGLYACAEQGESSAGGFFGWVEWEVNLRADSDLGQSSARVVLLAEAVDAWTANNCWARAYKTYEPMELGLAYRFTRWLWQFESLRGRRPQWWRADLSQSNRQLKRDFQSRL